MTALSANLEIPRQDGHIQDMAAGVDILYQNALAIVNAAGYVMAGTDVTAQWFAGVVVEKVDNSGGSAGDLDVRLYRDGVFPYAATGMAADDVGDLAYILDDQTVGLLAQSALTAGVLCGKIIRVESATKVWIDIAVGTRATVISAT